VPSGQDRHPPHRTGSAWTLGTVATVLSNPRYTGRQVWNRQRTDSQLADPANTSLGHRQVQRWNLPDGWVISDRPAHPALVSEADFIAAQDANAARGPASHADMTGPEQRRYLLAGLLACGGVRAADGVGMVQREAGVPLPPWSHQRRGT
jgi:site-specific DNA recombinase